MQIKFVFFGQGEKEGSMEIIRFFFHEEGFTVNVSKETTCVLSKEQDSSKSEDGEFSRLCRIFNKEMSLLIPKSLQKPNEAWSLLKTFVGKISQMVEGQLPHLILEEEKVIIFQTENWLEILATNIPLDWK